MYQALLASDTMPKYFLSTTPCMPYVATAAGCYHGGPFLSMAADEQQDTPSLPDHLRCGYTSKRCENPRTVKKSDGLHRFCAYHRERANKNQWRVDNRRRIQKKGSSGKSPTKSSEPPSSDCDSPRSTASTGSSLASHPLEDCEVSECALFFRGGNPRTESESLEAAGSPDSLSDQDAEILNAMLFDGDEENDHRTSRTTRELEVVATAKAPASSAAASLCDCSACTQSAGAMAMTRAMHYQRYGGNAARATVRWQPYARI